MLKIWADNLPAGNLDRHGQRGTTFAYLPAAPPERAVSVTMPVRTASWNQDFALLPVFDMNMPEGALGERMRLHFAKAVGSFDKLDVLSIIGRSQIGRLRYTAKDADLVDEVPFQSIDEILTSRRDGGLFAYLLDRFAVYSGISGVQPKVLVRDDEAAEGRRSTAVRGATHIVKFWDPDEYPELAANEHFCLEVAARCGLEVPRHRLSDDGGALVIDRFDLRSDGTYRGVEDFCVLNGYSSDDRYRGSYETAIIKRAIAFIQDPTPPDMMRLFTLLALNCAVRNGDAHLKNFAIVYDDPMGAAQFAPAYDIVTTAAYLPQDQMALTIEGSAKWPDAKRLANLGRTSCGLAPREIDAVFERIADGMSDTTPAMAAYAADHPGFQEIARRIQAAWTEGLKGSLDLGSNRIPAPSMATASSKRQRRPRI